jgi:hypothetical protein
MDLVMTETNVCLPSPPYHILFSFTGLARMFYESLSRDREDEHATWQPQGVGSEAYLNGTSLEPAPEDARKNGHIVRARCAPLSPASGFPVSWSQQVIHKTSGLNTYTLRGARTREDW